MGFKVFLHAYLLLVRIVNEDACTYMWKKKSGGKCTGGAKARSSENTSAFLPA